MSKSAKDLIGGAFAFQTSPFASTPKDSVKAAEYLVQALIEGVTWQQAKKHIRDYFVTQSVTSEYVEEQVKLAKEKLRPWLV